MAHYGQQIMDYILANKKTYWSSLELTIWLNSRCWETWLRSILQTDFILLLRVHFGSLNLVAIWDQLSGFGIERSNLFARVIRVANSHEHSSLAENCWRVSCWRLSTVGSEWLHTFSVCHGPALTSSCLRLVFTCFRHEETTTVGQRTRCFCLL